MKINALLTERAIIQEQILTDSTYREFYKLGILLREYAMDQQQIQQLFKQVADGAAAGGNVDKEGDAPASNRTVIGKGADVASAVADKYRGLKQWIGQTGPVKGLDAMIDSLQQQIVEKTGGEAGKLSQTVEFYRELSKVPGMALAVKAIIVGTLGLATAGLGGVAIAAGLTFANRMLQGDEFSSAVMGAMETGGTVAAIQTAKDLLTTTHVGADYGNADDQSFGEIPKTPDPNDLSGVDPNNVYKPLPAADALANNQADLKAAEDWFNADAAGRAEIEQVTGLSADKLEKLASGDYSDAANAAYAQNPDPSTGLPQDPTSSRSDYTAPDDIGSATEYKVTAADGKLGVGGIAQKYPGISAQDIIDYNNLSPDGLIKPGQVLQIPEPNLVSPASTNIWDRYEGPGPKDMDAVSDRANNLFKMQQDADDAYYKNKPDDFGVPSRSNDAVGNGMPGQLDSVAPPKGANMDPEYLNKVVSGDHARPMISKDDAQKALDWQDQNGGPLQQAGAASTPSGFNKEYLEKVISGEQPRPLISPEKAQELLDKMNQPTSTGSAYLDKLNNAAANGIKLRGLNQSYVNPKSMMREWIDVDTTARMWMLHESIGKRRGGIYLTNEGVCAVFHEVALRSQLTEGPWLDKLKGFNKKAGDAIGKFTAPIKKAAAAGWDSATNKITYSDLDRKWRRSAKLDKEASVDSEQVKQFLKTQGVKDPLINASFKALGLTAPTQGTVGTPSASASYASSTTSTAPAATTSTSTSNASAPASTPSPASTRTTASTPKPQPAKNPGIGFNAGNLTNLKQTPGSTASMNVKYDPKMLAKTTPAKEPVAEPQGQALDLDQLKAQRAAKLAQGQADQQAAIAQMKAKSDADAAAPKWTGRQKVTNSKINRGNTVFESKVDFSLILLNRMLGQKK